MAIGKSKPKIKSDAQVNTHLGDKVLVSEFNLKTNYGEIVTLKGRYNKIELFENVFSFAVSGIVGIKDTEGMLEKYRITGGEEIEIKLSKPITNEILVWRQDFVVHSISKSTVDKNLNTTFEINFTTKTFIQSLKRRYYSTFKNGISFKKAIQRIYSDISQNEISIEDPDLVFNDPFISTGLKPHVLIEYLAKRSCIKNKFFVCFERLLPTKGENAPHYFGSFENLIDQGISDAYTIAYQINTAGTRQTVKDLKTLKTPEFTRASTFNHLDVMMTGFYNTKITTIDPLTRAFSLEKIGYTNKEVEGDFYSHNLVYKNTIFSNYDDSRDEVPGERLIVSSYNDPYGKENWLSNNINGQILKNLFKVEVVVEGGTNNVGAGSIVNLKVPSHFDKIQNPKNSLLKDDPIYSGYYIVTAAKHTIIGDSYNKELQLSRGSSAVNFEKNTFNLSSPSIKGSSSGSLVKNKPAIKSTTKISKAKYAATTPPASLDTLKTDAISTETKVIHGTLISTKRDSSGTLDGTSIAALTKIGITLVPRTYRSTPDADSNIRNLYKQILRRSPDKVGLDYWKNILTTKAATLDEIALTFIKSEEAISTFGVRADKLITDKGMTLIANSIKKGDFKNVKEAVTVLYPDTLNNLTSEVLIANETLINNKINPPAKKEKVVKESNEIANQILVRKRAALANIVLPVNWFTLTASEKINFYNTKRITEAQLLAAGVDQGTIDWMKANGYTPG